MVSALWSSLLVGAIGFDGGKGLWDACRACSSRSLNRWAKQRNCEHAACARGLTRSATFVSSSLRGGNERHLVGWSRRESGTVGRDDTDWRAAHSPFFVAARDISRTATHVEFCSDRPFGRGFDSRRLHYFFGLNHAIQAEVPAASSLAPRLFGSPRSSSLMAASSAAGLRCM